MQNIGMKKALVYFALICLFFAVVPATSQAQCPMCRATLESNLKHGGTAGKGMNKGIFMMFFMPYILVGTMGFIWWRNRRDTQAEEGKE